MKSLVVYYSLYGNTCRLAEAIAARLAAAGPARAVGLDGLTPEELVGIDLLVIGSPTHVQNVPRVVRTKLADLPAQALVGKSVAAFDTSIKMWGPLMSLTAAHGLSRRLRHLGGKRVVRPRTFLVKSTEIQKEGEIDLLCDGQFDQAREWAAEILSRMVAKAA